MSDDEIKLFEGPWTEEMLAELPEGVRDIVANEDGVLDKCTVVFDHYASMQAAEEMVARLVNDQDWVLVERLPDRARFKRRGT